MSKKDDGLNIRMKDISIAVLNRLVRCADCRKPLIFVYCPSVRDKCAACGGKAKN